MTTQVRPISGGAWNNVSLDAVKCAKKNTTYGVTLSTPIHNMAQQAINTWVNCGGVGTAAVIAQARAAAFGLQLQEV